MSRDILAPYSTETPAQSIELSWFSQRLALRDSKEDWTGISNPAARRKLQNRLNQRARSKGNLSLV